MQENTLQQTPERPGRGKRGLLEAASPFSLFVKELPPITPPRNQWDSSSSFSGCPGFTGLSPAMAGFTTPKLASETTGACHEERGTRDENLKTKAIKVEYQQQPASKATSSVSLFSPPTKSNTPHRWRAATISAQPQAERDLFYSSIDRMRSPVYSTPEGSSGRLELKDTTGARGAGDVMDQPIETYASAPRVSRDLRHRKAQSSPQAVVHLARSADEDNSVMTALDSDMRADGHPSANNLTCGWETKLTSAGTGGRTWQYGQLKSPPETSSLHLPSMSLNSRQNQQNNLPAAALMASPALKAVMAAGGRLDQRLHSAAAVAALSAAAAATPVSRRLSSSSSGQGDSVVPPTTPDDEAKTRCLPASTSDQPKRCNCKKSRCLKLYCDCFAAGQYCKHACSCQSCLNTAENKDVVVSMRDQVRQRNPQAFQEKIEKQANGLGSGVSGLHKRGCHCKKSHCKKKYCECFQAGVNCGVHCKCDECHNTVEDGLPPPPRASKHSAAAAAAATAGGAADSNKTSPGTPPAPGKETSSMDARRTSVRSTKRKAWPPGGSATVAPEQPGRLTKPSTDSSGSQHRVASAGMLSPPDMVWPANNLAQAQGHVLGTMVGTATQVLSPLGPFDHSNVSKMLGRSLEQPSQVHQQQGLGIVEASQLASAPTDGRQFHMAAHSASQLGPSLPDSTLSPAEEKTKIVSQGRVPTSMHGLHMPSNPAFFAVPLAGLVSHMKAGACKDKEQPHLDVVMGHASHLPQMSNSMENKAQEPDKRAAQPAAFYEDLPSFNDTMLLRNRHPISAALVKMPGGEMALPRARHSEFSLADLAKAEEALCTATPWTELHLDTLHRAGHGAVIDVEQLMLGPEGVAYPSADALPERSQKGALKTEEAMQLEQAKLKRGLLVGAEAGRKKASHSSKNSKVRKLTDVPRLGPPQRSSSLPAPQTTSDGTQSTVMRSHSNSEDAGAEILSPSAPNTYGQGRMLRMGAGRTLISPK